MATYIPAFNIKDIANLYIEMLEGRELTTIYPDSPTHCDVFMRQGNAMSDPDFKYGMTSKVTIEDNKATFYDIPYGVSAGTIKEQIIKLGLSYELVNKKKVMKDKASVIPIKNVFTDCDKNDLTRVDIIVLFKKGADVELAVRRLMAATDLRVSYSANMHFIYKDKPTKVDLVTMSKLFLKEKIEYKTKSIAKQLGKAKDLLSNLLGLQKCISNIKFFEDVMNNIDIQDMYDLSDSQYSYIMSMTVKRLKGVKQGVLAQQIGSIQGNISDLESQHATTEVIKDYKKILDELPSRTCKVVSDPSNVTEFDLLEDKPMLFSSYTDGTVALVVDTIKSRGRGTKLQLLNIKDGDRDIITHSKCRLKDELIFVTNKGRIFKSKVYHILGVPSKALPMEGGECICDVLHTTGDFLIATSTHIMKARYSDVTYRIKKGIDGETPMLLPLKNYIVLVKNNKLVCTYTGSIPYRNLGSKGIQIVGNTNLITTTDEHILIYNRTGRAKRIAVSKLRLTNNIRAKGVMSGQANIIGLQSVTEDSEVTLYGLDKATTIKLDKIDFTQKSTTFKLLEDDMPILK